MVVLLVVAILLAIAIPTFLGVTKTADDRSVQSNLNTAITNGKALFQRQQQSYGTAATAADDDATQLHADEPSLQFGTGASSGEGQISVFVPTSTPGTAGTGIILAALSSDGTTCWYVVDNTVAQTATDDPYVNLSSYTPDASQAGIFYGEQAHASNCIASNIAASGTGNAFQSGNFPPNPSS